MRRHGRYTNAEVVRVLRQMAADIDEPSTDEWDSEGIRAEIVDRLEELDHPVEEDRS